jgi:hemoglobin
VEQTMFEKYGGFSTISRFVMSFYDRMLDDDDVGPFFDDVDLPKLIDHQTKFVSAIMGGPATFSDEHIAGAHKHLVVSDFHFDRLKELVRETLSDFDVTPEDIETVLDAFEQRRLLIVRPQNVD